MGDLILLTMMLLFMLDECIGFWFDKDKGEWWYGMYEPKSERSFRVYSPSTDAPIKATLNWILNNR